MPQRTTQFLYEQESYLRSNPRLSANKGFTLIELILVLAIITTLSILSTAFYARFLQQQSVTHTADRVVGMLRKAQQYSRSSKWADSWSVYYSAPTLTVFKGTTYITRNSSYDERYTVGSNIALTGLTTLNFARVTGLPSATPTVVITNATETTTITINSQGAVSR